MQKRHTILRSLLIIATPYTIWIHYSDTQTVHIWTLCHIRVQYGYILHNRLTIYDYIWLHSSIQYEYILQIHRCLYGLDVIFVYSMGTYFIIDWLYMTMYIYSSRIMYSSRITHSSRILALCIVNLLCIIHHI